jgi:phosphopantothenoylcysteine synthetase/decarboxylase
MPRPSSSRRADTGRTAADRTTAGGSVANGGAPPRVLLGICGSIAAYKGADLCSKLVQAGYDVTVTMTDAAQKLVGPLTMTS